MRYWVQYMTRAVWPAGSTELIDGCGDRAVYILDGRNTQETMRDDALKFAQRMEHFKRFEAFRICKGPRLFHETKSTKPETLNYPIHI